MLVRTLLLCACTYQVLCVEGPVVQLSQGQLLGRYGVSALGRTYRAFQGVPYAAPPVLGRRFQPPGPAQPWQGVWNATQPGSPCLQYMNTKTAPRVQGNEDCLFLNVFTSQLVPHVGLSDVIVFIHGGAFMYGGGHVPQPAYLMDSDVVLVTINYRLGMLGFLSTGDDVVPGNNGLKDQVAALQWIQENIAQFGGNADSVTIAGLSAGGASVHYHYLSPLSKGLFHRGISLSGSALCQWAQADDLPDKTDKLAAMLNCPTTSSDELVECLRGIPGKDIVSLTQHFQYWMYNPFSPWAPTVEPPSPQAFLSQPPGVVLRSSEVTSVPWLVGITSEEGLYPAAEFVSDNSLLRDLDNRWDYILPHLLDFNHTVRPHHMTGISQQIRRFYLGDAALTTDRHKEIVQMIGDRHFVVEAERAVRLQAASVEAPVYFYRFSYRGKHSFSEFMSNTTNDYGTCHGDDLAYVMQSPFRDTDKTEGDRAMSKLLLKIWTSYASTGIPTVGDTDIKWQPVSSDTHELRYLHIGGSNDVGMRTTKDLGKRHFWDLLPFNAHHLMADRLVDEL